MNELSYAVLTLCDTWRSTGKEAIRIIATDWDVFIVIQQLEDLWDLSEKSWPLRWLTENGG